MRTLSSFAAAALIFSAATYSAPASAGGGDALLGGVVGFAAGTLFGTATARPRYYYYEPVPVYVAPPPVAYSYAPEPWTPEWYAYCGKRFVSFDARSGTYLGHDGYRRMCH
jgi:hypothetical protein